MVVSPFVKSGDDDSVTVIMIAQPDLQIRYTLDGANPSPSKGLFYSGPFKWKGAYRTQMKAISYSTLGTVSHVVEFVVGRDGAVLAQPGGELQKEELINALGQRVNELGQAVVTQLQQRVREATSVHDLEGILQEVERHNVQDPDIQRAIQTAHAIEKGWCLVKVGQSREEKSLTLMLVAQAPESRTRLSS